MTSVLVNDVRHVIKTNDTTTVSDILKELKIEAPKNTDDIDLTEGYYLNGKNVKIWTIIPKYYRHTEPFVLYMGLRAKVEGYYKREIHIEVNKI